MAEDPRAALDALIHKAEMTATGMRRVAEGKAPDAVTHSNAETFQGIADLLTELSRAAASARPVRQNQDAARLARAVHRIANLHIRNAPELLGRNDWKRVAIELQAIAQDCVMSIAPEGGTAARR